MAEPTYTIFVRVPIPRGDFIDPPPVNWDAKKDEDLWNILSGATKQDIDWSDLADRFDVTVDFLLQQVAYLSERHASQLRAQLRKATAAAKGSSAPSPIPGAEPGGHQRTASALSFRRDSPAPRNDGSAPGTPITTSMRPNFSRNTSAKTTVLTQNLVGAAGSSPRPGKGLFAAVEGSHRRRLSSLPVTMGPPQSPGPPSPGPLESSSAPSDSDDESSPAQSRIIRRPPRHQQQQADGAASLGDEDDDAEPAFAAFKSRSSGSRSKGTSQDLGATLRGNPRDFARRGGNKSGSRDQGHQSQTSDSSTSSAALISRAPISGDRSKPPGPLSPRRTAELAGKTGGSGSRAKGYSREGSEGTPSMGSSFSDLDDASVTQSALEEHLASKMQDGAIGSRFSISQAFKSRYVPKQGQNSSPN